MSRTLSDDGAAFIAGQEGAVPFWYVDATGHWTIGIGHLWDGSDEFGDVAVRHADGSWDAGRRLSDAEMWDLFRTDAARYVEAVDRLVTVTLTQRQFDMLVDFAFNWGIGAAGGFPATSILHLVNAGDFAAVAAELVNGRGPVTDDHPDGRPYDKGLAGVRRRRQLEAEAFMVAAVKSVEQIIREAIAECEAAGRPVVIIDGAEDRGRPFRFDPQCVRCHHTATRGYDFDYPSLGIVRDGRSDLPGPLSQFGLGRHTGTIYVVAFGYANDGGGGGWMGLSGNGSGFGIEAENDGIGEEWGEEITESYIVLVAALLRAMGKPAEWACRHAEWSDGGKIDTATAPFNNGDWIRARVAERLAATPDPAPVPLEEDYTMFIGDAPPERGGGVWQSDGVLRKPVRTGDTWSQLGDDGERVAKHIGVFKVGTFDDLIDIEAVLAGLKATAVDGVLVEGEPLDIGPLADAVAAKVADLLHDRLAG